MRSIETPAQRRSMWAKGFASLMLAGSALLAFGAPAAQAVSSADQIVQACADQTVCLFDGAAVSNASELQGSLPEGVRVVVIPQPDQAQSVQSSTIAAEIKSATGAETVIVIEDRAKDRFAVVSSDDATAITEALYSQNESDGGVAVAAIQSTLASPTGSEGVDGPGGAGLLLIGAVLVGAALAAGGLVWFVRSRRRAGRKEHAISARLEKELAAALNGEDGQYISDAVESLDQRASAYPEIASQITSMAQHVSELFVRVRKRGTDQQLRLLQAQYKDTLGKLLKALNDDYYGDISKNPQYWSNPEARLAEVRRAVESVDQQAVENIRQVNESRDLEFKVALDSLIKTVAEAKLSDVYSDREK